MTVTDDGIQTKQWRQGRKHERTTTLDVAKQLPELLRQRCGGLNVGLCLSGGIDSSSVLAVQCESIADEKMIPAVTLSDGSTAALAEDNRFAEQMAAAFSNHIDHFKVDWRPDAVSSVRDQPILDQDEFGLAALYHALAARQCRVALSGDGADELFCGYDRIFREFREYGQSGMSRNGFIDTFIARYSYCDFEGLHSLLSFYGMENHLDSLKDYVEALLGQTVNPGRGWVREFFIRHHLYWLLRKSDFASGQYGIESRAPFLHPQIRHLTDAILIGDLTSYVDFPPESDEAASRIKGTLKTAFASRLPNAVVNREKMPFPIPETEILSHAKNRLGESPADFVPHALHSSLIAGTLGTQATLLYTSYLRWFGTCQAALVH